MTQNYSENNLLELHDAIMEQDIQKIQELVEAGCDINGNNGAYFEDGITFLMVAVATGNLEMIELLVELGADVNAVSTYGNSALSTAYLNEFPDIADYLKPLTSPEIQAWVEKDVEKYLSKSKGSRSKSKKSKI